MWTLECVGDNPTRWLLASPAHCLCLLALASAPEMETTTASEEELLDVKIENHVLQYGIAAIISPIFVMLVVNFIRVRLCRGLMYVAGIESEEPTTLELSKLEANKQQATAPKARVEAVIADDSDDDNDDDHLDDHNQRAKDSRHTADTPPVNRAAGYVSELDDEEFFRMRSKANSEVDSD